jgi:hypothetical protein
MRRRSSCFVMFYVVGNDDDDDDDKTENNKINDAMNEKTFVIIVDSTSSHKTVKRYFTQYRLACVLHHASLRGIFDFVTYVYD